jgi:hypothetical protein
LFWTVLKNHVERGGCDRYQLCTKNRPNELLNLINRYP